MVRVLDENKRKSISDAAIKLIVTEGFSATSMHRIAQEAKVAASTIYLYFENKEDMLNKVYLMVKRDFSDHLLERFDSMMDVKEGMRCIYDNIVVYFEENPMYSSFMEQFENSALISDLHREQAMNNYVPVLNMVERGIKEGVLKNVQVMTICGFFFYPIVAKIRRAHYEGTKVSNKEKEDVFNMAWDAVKA